MFIALLLFFLVASAVSDGKPASACEGTEFPCSNGVCIDKSKWCDTEVDCDDGSDEKYCFMSSSIRPHPNKCDETFFVCNDGPCIPLVGRCDGYTSCHDNSDEYDCGKTTFIENKTEVFTVHTSDEMNIKDDRTEISVVTDAQPMTEDFSHLYPNDALNVEQNTISDNLAEDLEKGFIELDARAFRRELGKAQQWLLKVRQHDYGWGDETARALTALYVTDGISVQKQSDQKMLMSKQLNLMLFTALVRNITSPIPLGDLSIFINALFASCENPRNFYGQDLVTVLRQRANLLQGTSSFISPLVYLTLCLNNATTYNDVRKVQEMMFGTPNMDGIDIEALVSLAATCMSRKPKFASYSIGQQVANNFYHKMARRGLPENVYQLALVTQALNEARINQNLWNRTEALRLITLHQDTDGSFGDFLSTYYTMPVLLGRSLLSLGQHCDTDKDKGLTPLEVLRNGEEDKIYVQYSLYFGNPVDVSHNLMMKVKKSTNFLDIMRMAETVNPVYTFKYDMDKGKPTVYSIGGAVNDPEKGLYWKLHVSSQNSTDLKNSLPYEGDIRSFVPSTRDYIVFWMKSLY